MLCILYITRAFYGMYVHACKHCFGKGQQSVSQDSVRTYSVVPQIKPVSDCCKGKGILLAAYGPAIAFLGVFGTLSPPV